MRYIKNWIFTVIIVCALTIAVSADNSITLSASDIYSLLNSGTVTYYTSSNGSTWTESSNGTLLSYSSSLDGCLIMPHSASVDSLTYFMFDCSALDLGYIKSITVNAGLQNYTVNEDGTLSTSSNTLYFRGYGNLAIFGFDGYDSANYLTGTSSLKSASAGSYSINPTIYYSSYFPITSITINSSNYLYSSSITHSSSDSFSADTIFFMSLSGSSTYNKCLMIYSITYTYDDSVDLQPVIDKIDELIETNNNNTTTITDSITSSTETITSSISSATTEIEDYLSTPTDDNQTSVDDMQSNMDSAISGLDDYIKAEEVALSQDDIDDALDSAEDILDDLDTYWNDSISDFNQSPMTAYLSCFSLTSDGAKYFLLPVIIILLGLWVCSYVIYGKGR